MTSIYNLFLQNWVLAGILIYAGLQICIVVIFVLIEQSKSRFQSKGKTNSHKELKNSKPIPVQKNHSQPVKNWLVPVSQQTKLTSAKDARQRAAKPKKSNPLANTGKRAVILLPPPDKNTQIYYNIDSNKNRSRTESTRTLAAPRRYMQDIVLRVPTVPRLPQPQK